MVRKKGLDLIYSLLLIANLSIDGVERVPHLVGDSGADVGHVLLLGPKTVIENLFTDVYQLDGEFILLLRVSLL